MICTNRIGSLKNIYIYNSNNYIFCIKNENKESYNSR